MSTDAFPLAVWSPNTLQNSIPANDNALRMEMLLGRVNSATTTAQPGSPADGDIYIIPSGATGAMWATFTAGDLAVYYSGTWYAIDPDTAFKIARVVDTGALLAWNGSAWVNFETLLGAKGTDIASAGTTNLATATGWFVHVTGTTTTTALGTAKAGTLRWVVYDGALTLTHHATSMILPGGANITTAAGDAALWVSEGSGHWRCVFYQKADGTPLVLTPGAMEYKGAWNASTNTPTLAGGVGNNGDTYRVSVAGTQNLGGGSTAYEVGDSVVYNATTTNWDHFDNSQAPITSGDVTTALGYTPARTYKALLDMGSVSGAQNIDLSYAHIKLTLSGNVTLTFTNLPAAGYMAETTVEFVQDGTGGRTITFPGGTAKWPRGVPLDTSAAAASQQDDVAFRVRSSGDWSAYPAEDMS
jgi:hypothetical protein